MPNSLLPAGQLRLDAPDTRHFVVGTNAMIHPRFVDPDYPMFMTTENMLDALRSAT